MRPELSPHGVWAGQLGLVEATEVRRAARHIEEAGFGAIWVGEADGREALTHAGLVLAATERIVVATGIANIWARDAQAMVNAARTLAEGYGERFLLGIGASHAPLVSRRGHRYDRPYAAMVDYLDAMAVATYTSPPPTQEPPVLLAALGPRMLRLAGERADGAHTFLVPVEHTRRARRVLGARALLVPEQAAVLARDRPAARALAGDHVARYLDLPNYRRHLDRLGWPAPDLAGGGSDDLFDALVAWGGPDDVGARVRAHLDAGADQVALHLFTDRPTRLPLDELATIAAHLAPEGPGPA